VDFGAPLAGTLDSPEAVAGELDREILGRLRLFPVNLLALRELAKSDDAIYADAWAQVRESLDELPDESGFYAQLVDCPDEYKEQWLKLYANPVLNKLKRSGL
jgi:hypothetical protein